ncbi:hypothetical protein HBN50_01525 [Halobacteriovorax sp. GB3]|uniref:hypothetical protein n=1 Tax=Halobacteriovorax sp. GB3 TaxID=2719615 RepID=UPI00235EC019|nr:hypothetical protein [Halobacteriovorax sp. GB3]MDD0851749.1 hypothetical protein [Halobacteriovorax sp. GB3]
MLRNAIIPFIFFLTGVIANSSTLAKDQVITWMTFDYPPIYQSNHKGFGDIVLKQFKQCLEGYKHVELGQSSFPRIFKFLDSKKSIYCLPALGTEPKVHPDKHISKLVFTIPNAFIVIRKEDEAKFKGKNNKVSLETLFRKTSLIGGMVEKGTYGEQVNELIKKYENRVLKRNAVDPVGFYKMLHQKRFDFFFEYPVSFIHHVRNLSVTERNEFSYLLLRENTEMGPIKAYALCSAQSSDVIEKINKCLSDPLVQKSYVESLVDELPLDLQKKYRNLNFQKIGI